MAKYAGSNFSLTFNAQNMTAHILSINGVDVESIMDDGKPFGVAWPVPVPTGDKQASDVEVEGMYDDAAGGPSAVFLAALPTAPSTAAVALSITWGGAKVTSGNAFCVKFSRMVVRNQVTRYRATLRWTGTVSEA